MIKTYISFLLVVLLRAKMATLRCDILVSCCKRIGEAIFSREILTTLGNDSNYISYLSLLVVAKNFQTRYFVPKAH